MHVIDLWLSHDLIKMVDDDLVACLHYFLIVMLESVQVKLKYGLLVQKLGDDQFTEILEKFLTTESISL